MAGTRPGYIGPLSILLLLLLLMTLGSPQSIEPIAAHKPSHLLSLWLPIPVSLGSRKAGARQETSCGHTGVALWTTPQAHSCAKPGQEPQVRDSKQLHEDPLARTSTHKIKVIRMRSAALFMRFSRKPIYSRLKQFQWFKMVCLILFLPLSLSLSNVSIG